MQLDGTNKSILAILQNNARLPNTEIARQVGLTTSAVHERIRKMEKAGVIRSYAGILDAEALGQDLLAFVGIRLSPHREAMAVSEALANTPGVEEVYHMAGEECFLIKIRCAGTKALESILLHINDIPTVNATRTNIALRASKESPGPQIPFNPKGE